MASWANVAEELRLEIARQAVIPSRPSPLNSWGYPQVPDLDASSAYTDRRSLQYFRDIASKEFLHIRVFACTCVLHDNNVLGNHLYNNFMRNRKRPDMSDYENNFGLALQTMTFELMCRACDGCQPRAMELPLFLRTPDMLFTFYGIVMSYAVDEMDVTIHVAIDYDRPRAQAIKILDDMKKILCKIDVTATSTLPAGYDLQAFRTAVGREIVHAKDLVETYEAHYDAYVEAVEKGVGGAQLVSGLLMYEGTIDTQNLEAVEDFWD